jgi:hypothetical protein
MKSKPGAWGLAASVAILGSFLISSFSHAQQGISTQDLDNLLQTFGLTSGQTTTTTQPTPPTTPTDGRQPITNGINNVSLGSLQNRAPGQYTQQAIALRTGTLQIPGNADQFEESVYRDWFEDTLFGVAEAILSSTLQGLAQLINPAFLANLFGPGNINVGDPLANQTTTSTGTVIPLP